jgi:hypothetical protein
VALVIARPIGYGVNKPMDGRLPTDELRAYDIEVADENSDKAMRLKDLGLVAKIPLSMKRRLLFRCLPFF